MTKLVDGLLITDNLNNAELTMTVSTTGHAHFLVSRAARLRAGVKTMWIRLVFLTTAGEEGHFAGRSAPGLNSYLAKPVNYHASKAFSGPGMSWLHLNQLPGAV